MNTEPDYDEIAGDNSTPATKADVEAVAVMTKTAFDQVQKQIRAMEARMLDEFQAAVENIHQDVAGANRDEISGIQDRQADHEDRLARLEQSAGLPGTA